MAAKAGDDFNLSVSELDMIRTVSAGDKTPTEVAAEIYRSIMLNRWEAYRKSGLKGTASYARGGYAAGPATELREMTESNQITGAIFPCII